MSNHLKQSERALSPIEDQSFPTENHQKNVSIAVHTLGCRLNQYETDAIASDLARRGFSIVENTNKADVHIVNTCTVTQKAARKSKNIMNRAKSLSNALTIVTGCLATEEKDSFKASYDALIVDNDRKSHIADIVNSYFSGEVIDPDTLNPSLFHYQTQSRMFHTRTLVKIQDGCDNLCTFCIIPSVRGRASSRPPQEVLAHIRESIRSGSKEIVLTGVNITRYRYEQWDFYHLLEAILSIPGNFRVRLSSVEPEIDIPRIRDLVSHEKFCPHLHLCLQSGSNRILLKMRREYTIREFINIVESMRAVDPRFNITTDVIVGFPGESSHDFAETLRIAQEVHFGHIHVFPYSKRSGTRAERYPDAIDPQEKKERIHRLIELSSTLTQQYRKGFIGKELQMLTEEQKTLDSSSAAYGLSRYYVPILLHGTHKSNSLLTVSATKLLETGELSAKLSEQNHSTPRES